MNVSVETLGRLIKMNQHRLSKKVDQALATFEITIVGWAALRQISENPDASQHALAMMTFNSDQAFGTLAQRLTKHGLIARREGVGRAIIHGLTPRGKQVLKKCDRLVQGVMAKNFAPLSQEEQIQLARLLEKTLTSDS